VGLAQLERVTELLKQIGGSEAGSPTEPEAVEE
jgi:hypothetical protein